MRDKKMQVVDGNMRSVQSEEGSAEHGFYF
jgi:hypothetical protein